MKQRLEVSLRTGLIITPEMQLSLEVLSLPLMELRELVDRELLENPFLEEMSPPPDAYYPEDELPWWERLPDRGPSLMEHLLTQVSVLPMPEEDIYVMKKIASRIDNRGYLAEAPEILSSTLGVSLDRFEVLRKRFMESVEPEGCGAVSFEEFLHFQLKRLGLDPSSLDEDGIRKVVASNGSIRPYPAWGWGELEVGYIEPDAFVVRVGEEYQVYLNERYTPRLVLNEQYRELLYRKDLDQSTLEFLRSKMKRAVGMAKAVEQRNRTLRKVVETIVEFEREFLERGPAHLVPLNLKDVSEKVELHLSTVSRVVNSKYVHTPQGTYPLKFFFEDKGFRIKMRIREIIASEDKRRPLSDSAIARLLREEGFDIARRTVAKYREELGIPSSSRRRVR